MDRSTRRIAVNFSSQSGARSNKAIPAIPANVAIWATRRQEERERERTERFKRFAAVGAGSRRLDEIANLPVMPLMKQELRGLGIGRSKNWSKSELY